MQRLFSVVVFFWAVFTVVTADYQNDALKKHNEYRRKSKSPDLALSDELNSVAQDWAEYMAHNEFKHSGGKYGENLYMSSNKKLSDSEAVIEATDSWYKEKSLYNFRLGRFSGSTGHFTQVVWKDTKYLGIGLARSSKGVFVCANYDPRGNVVGQFLQNVLKPLR